MNRLIFKAQNNLINNLKQNFSILSNQHVSKDSEVKPLSIIIESIIQKIHSY
jgi:hypothetical protein